MTGLTLDHVFRTNIIAYCQQNRYVRLAIYTDLFTLIGRFENVDHGLTGLTKVFGNNPCKETFVKDVFKAELFNRIVTTVIYSNIGNTATLILPYIKSVSEMFY